jgi:phosphoribosyl 1,2-cyclic phosphate phosphodiesterase
MKFITIIDEPFHIGRLAITPVEVLHGPMPVKGYRFGDFAYITDAKTVAPEERDKLRGVKTLVVNALRHEFHYSHFTIDEAIAFSRDIKPDVTYFIHMSHQFGLHAETEKQLPPGFKIAYDGLKITV